MAAKAETELEPQLDLFSETLLQHVDEAERLRKETLDSINAFLTKLKKIKILGEKTVLQLLRMHEFESLSSTFGADLKAAAEHLYTLESHRGAEINRLNVKVFQEFGGNGLHEEHEKGKKDIIYILRQLKQCMAEERRAIRSLQRAATEETGGFFHTLTNTLAMKSSSSSHGWKLEMKKANWREAHHQLEHIASQLNDRVKFMEVTRARQIRQFMMRFVEIQMVFHAKALELLTNTFQTLDTRWRNNDTIEEDEWAATKGELGLNHVEAAIAIHKKEGERLDNPSQDPPQELKIPGANLSSSTPNISRLSSAPSNIKTTGSNVEVARPRSNPRNEVTLRVPTIAECDGEVSGPFNNEEYEFAIDTQSSISNASDLDRRFEAV